MHWSSDIWPSLNSFASMPRIDGVVVPKYVLFQYAGISTTAQLTSTKPKQSRFAQRLLGTNVPSTEACSSLILPPICLSLLLDPLLEFSFFALSISLKVLVFFLHLLFRFSILLLLHALLWLRFFAVTAFPGFSHLPLVVCESISSAFPSRLQGFFTSCRIPSTASSGSFAGVAAGPCCLFVHLLVDCSIGWLLLLESLIIRSVVLSRESSRFGARICCGQCSNGPLKNLGLSVRTSSGQRANRPCTNSPPQCANPWPLRANLALLDDSALCPNFGVGFLKVVHSCGNSGGKVCLCAVGSDCLRVFLAGGAMSSRSVIMFSTSREACVALQQHLELSSLYCG